MLKNSGNYFREYMISDEELARSNAEYITKLRQQYLSMGMERLFVDEIQEHLEFKHNDVNRELSKKRLKYILDHEDKETIMEKYAFLSYLVHADPTGYTLGGLNYFKHTVFAPLFAGTPAAELLPSYMEVEHQVRTEFFALVNEQIDRVPIFAGDPCARLRKTSQEELVQKTLNAITSGSAGKVVFDAKGEKYQVNKAVEMVAAKVLRTVQQRMENGENQSSALLALRNFRVGAMTDEDHEALQNLIVEATVDTDLIKLPPIFKEKMSTFAHLHKKKVADSIVNHVTNRVLALGGRELSGFQENESKPRNAITVTPEVIEKFQRMQSMSMEKISQDQELLKLVETRCVGINLEQQSKELLKSEHDAKLHQIIFNPNDAEVPINLASMTPEELEANGITAFKGAEIQIDNTGKIRKAKTNDQKLLSFFSQVESLYDKKKAKNSGFSDENSDSPKL